MDFDFYEWFLQSKADKLFKLKDIAALLGKEYDAIRMAINRMSFTELEKREILKIYNPKETEQTENLKSAKKTPKLVSLYLDGIEGFANDDAVIEFVISNESRLLNESTKFQIYFENIRLRAQKEVLMATGK